MHILPAIANVERSLNNTELRAGGLVTRLRDLITRRRLDIVFEKNRIRIETNNVQLNNKFPFISTTNFNSRSSCFSITLVQLRVDLVTVK